MEKKKIAVVGSAANPVTLAHREFAEALTGAHLFDLVLWVPSGKRKDKPNLAAPGDRVAMTELAFDEEWRKSQPTEFRIDLREAYRDLMPTIELSSEIQKEYPDAEIIFATGVDVLAPNKEYGGLSDVLRYWVEGERLLRERTFAVYPREGYPDPALLQQEGKIPKHFLILPRPQSSFARISSTEVRRRIAQGEPFEAFVHPKVAEYIRAHGLYRQPSIPQ